MPTRYDYYKARAREHRVLAAKAPNAQERAMHTNLVTAYQALAREHCLRQVLTVKAAA